MNEYYAVDVDYGNGAIETITIEADSVLDALSKSWNYGQPVADPEVIDNV